MSTMTPAELLKLWTRDNIPPEMAIGHVVQNLVKHQTALETLSQGLSTLRVDIDRLLAQSAVSASEKSKKPTKAS